VNNPDGYSLLLSHLYAGKSGRNLTAVPAVSNCEI